MTRRISILGSTGSIGTQTIDVARRTGAEIMAIAAGTNTRLLAEQVAEFNPCLVSVSEEKYIESFRFDFRKLIGTEFRGTVLSGPEGLVETAAVKGADMAVVAVTGIKGLLPVLAAISEGKSIALANKETLVAGGRLVTEAASEKGVGILPVDSEHSAVFQCIAGNRRENVSRIILTASGGPFRKYSLSELEKVTVDQAMNHPNWKMGKKVTIDSATLMNKGLEVIEARWLFGIEGQKIDVLIHPQSIIHSMVEYCDGSVMAQLGVPDMRIPIQLALTWPERRSGASPAPDFTKTGPLTFEPPDLKRFPCLGLAYRALSGGKGLSVIMNAANEMAVESFLNGKTEFTDIPEIVRRTMDALASDEFEEKIENIMELDSKARDYACNIADNISDSMIKESII